jgi:hypothetical protein
VVQAASPSLASQVLRDLGPLFAAPAREERERCAICRFLPGQANV